LHRQLYTKSKKDKPVQCSPTKVTCAVLYKATQIRLADSTNRINISTRTVVLCDVTSQTAHATYTHSYQHKITYSRRILIRILLL